ncbi:hypothetical protein [Arenivirga flava]|uniref:Uncharacterized protein n=1 Tax=Arenivirga flava TaxID=1930060 RepID=A0AA37XAH6_9MICO|nr:hypothetical protein [Arenivirga flava]GMA27420.1 hypothetical protein GCM10025874_06730 [Arenivirga flava]
MTRDPNARDEAELLDESLGERERREKDRAESPGSERETRAKQDDPPAYDDPAHDDIDESQVRIAPGTGGPDDVGDVEVDERDIHIPGRDAT